MRHLRTICLALPLIAGATTAFAEAIHYDVFVTSTGTGSQLLIGGYDDTALTALVPAEQIRVFGGEAVGSGTAAAYESEAPGEPGFRGGDQAFLSGPATSPSGVYTALVGGTPLTFTFQPMTIGSATRNLFFWDGAGAVRFTPVGGNVAVGLTKYGGGSWTAAISGTSSGAVAGNTIQSTSPTGGVHTHLFTSIAKDGAAPDQGFYLYALQLGMAGYVSSDPIYFVFGALDPAALAPQFADLTAFETAHGLAESWVATNLVPVPEPSATLLAVLGFVGTWCLRRRGNRPPSCRSSKPRVPSGAWANESSPPGMSQTCAQRSGARA